MGALTKINVQRKIRTAEFKMDHCDSQNQPLDLETGQRPRFWERRAASLS
jgi:hypothetical protein